MSRRIAVVLICLVILNVSISKAQSTAETNVQKIAASVKEFRRANERNILRELIDFLSIPNVASDIPNIRKNAQAILQMLKRRGIQAQLLELEGSPPAVFGELKTTGASKTIILYSHYDGQPVNPAQWSSDPWKPIVCETEKNSVKCGKEIDWQQQGSMSGEWRVYARSASDDKSPIIAMLSALDALRSANVSPTVNLKFFFEGEEEAGSEHMKAMLEKHKHLLQSDLWLLADGPVHQTRRPKISYGVRGVTDVEMTVYGAVRALHSGHYGNWTPNPAALLTNLLATMRNADGRILIDGFYEDVKSPTPTELQAIRQTPENETQLMSELGLSWVEGDGKQRLLERILLPALNIRGVQSGHTGATAQNAVPTEATASIDFRLVPDQTPQSVKQKVEAHVQSQGFFITPKSPTPEERRKHGKIISLEWNMGYPSARTPMDLAQCRAVRAVMDQLRPGKTVNVPSEGGSIPIHMITETLHTPFVIVPIVNHDNNQHAADENLRLQNLWDGIETFAALISSLGNKF